MALARAVMPSGKVYSYEMRPKMLSVARRNLARAGLLDYVELAERDAAEGFGLHNADSCFLDVRHPWELLAQVREALKPGGFFGSILPTTNQVSMLVDLLARAGFVEIVDFDNLLRFPTRDRECVANNQCTLLKPIFKFVLQYFHGIGMKITDYRIGFGQGNVVNIFPI